MNASFHFVKRLEIGPIESLQTGTFIRRLTITGGDKLDTFPPHELTLFADNEEKLRLRLVGETKV